LELADVTASNTFGGRAVESITGRSLLPVLQEPSRRHREVDETVGYELAGHGALFRGDLKLLRIPPPIGDGRWRLYDIAKDPGETRDLSLDLPTEYAEMIAAYARYEQENGVLPLPAGYEPRKQVSINAFLFVYLPYMKWIVGLVVLVLAAWWVLARRRRNKS
jgi:arylsulfatase A-like enzyme